MFYEAPIINLYMYSVCPADWKIGAPQLGTPLNWTINTNSLSVILIAAHLNRPPHYVVVYGRAIIIIKSLFAPSSCRSSPALQDVTLTANRPLRITRIRSGLWRTTAMDIINQSRRLQLFTTTTIGCSVLWISFYIKWIFLN